jgi:hypothetical protein
MRFRPKSSERSSISTIDFAVSQDATQAPDMSGQIESILAHGFYDSDFASLPIVSKERIMRVIAELELLGICTDTRPTVIQDNGTILEIRQRYEQLEDLSTLVKDYRLSPATLYCILRGEGGYRAWPNPRFEETQRARQRAFRAGGHETKGSSAKRSSVAGPDRRRD